MFTLKGLLLILFYFLSWKIAEPMSALFGDWLFNFWIGLQLSITCITAGVMTKVFTIISPNNEDKPARFLFISLNYWVYISLVIGIIFGVIWLFIH